MPRNLYCILNSGTACKKIFSLLYCLYILLYAIHLNGGNIVPEPCFTMVHKQRNIATNNVFFYAFFRVLDLVEIIIKKQPCSELILVSVI